MATMKNKEQKSVKKQDTDDVIEKQDAVTDTDETVEKQDAVTDTDEKQDAVTDTDETVEKQDADDTVTDEETEKTICVQDGLIISRYKPVQLKFYKNIETGQAIEPVLIDCEIDPNTDGHIISNSSLYLYEMLKILQKAEELGAFDEAKKIKQKSLETNIIHTV